ncbi:glycosyltransferase family 39 protein [Desulfitobacterium hafniense]|uniref:glycosyltransferase family 39 protein n=1 Tax=Desulfitobacterium hafniense TaxID=49338 RepID=UPI0003999433|nr:glycosyltransferase family 39 protein [Desulfitobacterium hafniense]
MFWILLIGLLADVLWVMLVPTVPFSDFSYYHHLATQIAGGGPWGDTYTSVGYPIFLGFFYKLFGSSLWVAKCLNIALSTANNILVYFLLKKISIPGRLRNTFLLLFVLFPMNVYYNSLVASEILFTTGLLSVLLLYFSNLRWKYVGIGLLTGLNAMVKPFFPAFVLAVFLVEVLSERNFRQSLKRSGIVLLVALVVLSPWLYRNSKMFGDFCYISNNSGIVLYINNNSQNKVGGWMPAEDVADSLVKTPAYQEANALEKNKMLSAAAKEWIAGHPVEFVGLGIKRLARTFLFFGDINYALRGTALAVPSIQVFLTAPGSNWLSFFLFLTSELVRAPVFWLGCLGILSYSWRVLRGFFRSGGGGPRRINKEKLTLLITFLMFAGIYFITEGQSRYAFPTVMMLIYFALWRVYQWQDEMGE